MHLISCHQFGVPHLRYHSKRQADGHNENIFALLGSGDKNTVKVREQGPRRSTWTFPGKAKPRRYNARRRPTPLAPERFAAAGRGGVRSGGLHVHTQPSSGTPSFPSSQGTILTLFHFFSFILLLTSASFSRPFLPPPPSPFSLTGGRPHLVSNVWLSTLPAGHAGCVLPPTKQMMTHDSICNNNADSQCGRR